MKSKVVGELVFICLFAAVGFGTPNTEIWYEIADLGSDRWEYNYAVENISLTGGIEEFTIWFEYGLYENLAIETLDPLATDWDEIVWQPEPIIEDDGAYDALALNLNIVTGETVNGFAVSFDWLGTGVPGSQFYEVVDPTTYDTIDSGYTVPEPLTVLFLAGGAVVILRKKHTIVKHRKY
ncbi:MAG: hypothetical protein KAS75_01210 [Planctomycetes bacterium]|nr:hypothetical protein [Planctomycetota bacterium]